MEILDSYPLSLGVMGKFYVYVYLDPRKPGLFYFREVVFEYEPFYVGKGCGSRFKNSMYDYSENRVKGNLIKKIQSVTGHLPVVLIPYQFLEEKEAFDLERAMITHFGRKVFKNGILCNISDGGEGSSGVVRSEENRKKIKAGNRSVEICGKPVFQYSLDGVFVKKYPCVSEVCRENLGFHLSEISKCCRRGGTRYGFQWFYLDKGYLIKPVQAKDRSSSFKQVCQFKESGEMVAVYNSLNEASKETGFLISRISECCRGHRESYKGFKFKYIQKQKK